MLRLISAYVIGVIVSFVLGSVIGTQMVLHSVQSMGLAVSWSSRLATTGSDIAGLSVSLMPLMALILTIGWAVTDWVSVRVSRYRHTAAFALMGAGCILILHPLLNMVFGVDAFAPARTPVGLIAQGIAGAVGGLCFAKVRLLRARHLPTT